MDPFHHLNTAFSNPYHPLLSSSPPHHHHFPPPLPPPLPPPPPVPPAADPPERERLPQWSHAETAAFLAIRADLDHSFLSTKRNKALWEAVAARLHAHGAGYARTPDQCKSKWKNLVTRFKGTASDVATEGDPSAAARGTFPFHDEMRRIFDARVERARAMEAQKAKGKDPAAARGDPDDEDGDGGGGEDYDEEEAEMLDEEVEETRGAGRKKRRRKAAPPTVGSGIEMGEVEAVLREFMRRQMEMEERWMEAAEARDAERRAREEEWRAAMVALGEERLALVRRWREREDAWRARAEEREERRHQLVAALLAKLGGGDTS
ncbi:unnamed protein product [Alopecurus aequalis]